MDTETSKPQVQSVINRIDQEEKRDNSTHFECLKNTMAHLRGRMLEEFSLQVREVPEDLTQFKTDDGNCEGAMQVFHGGPVEYLVDSHLASPKQGFTNLHFNTWLNAEIDTPHLAIVLGTMPNLFFYFDLIPRYDLSIAAEYLDLYYEPLNELFIDFVNDSSMQPFVSENLYMRTAISPTGMCYTCDLTDENIQRLAQTANKIMDQWITWVKSANPVGKDKRRELSERDLILRKTVAERDPANNVAYRLFGKDFSDRLIQTLWGIDNPIH